MRTEQMPPGLMPAGSALVALETPTPAVCDDPTRRAQVGFSRILVPVDFSPTTPALLALVWSLIKPGGGALWLLHVVERTPGMCGVVIAKTDEEVADTALRLLQRLGRRWTLPGVSVGSVVRIGRLADEICRFAMSAEVDLILLGRDRHGLWDQLWLQSATQRVLRKASCPVMIVPAGGMPGDCPPGRV